jgi:hypothetical protein
MEPMEQLLDYLATVPVGAVTDTADLAECLAACWDEYAGSSETDVAAAELAGRLHSAVWRPPVLSLEFEPKTGAARRRFGAPLPRWLLDTEKRSVTQSIQPSRPPSPNRPKLNIVELAQQITRLVVEHRDDFRLRWYSDGSVRVAVGVIFPEGAGFKQTVSNRRRKFRMALDEKLTAAGWRRVKDYVYGPPAK